MSGRGQIIFGLTFVACGAAAYFGETEAARNHGRDPNIGWMIGAAGFALPGLLNVALGIKSGGLSAAAWSSDTTLIRRLASALGLTLGLVGVIVMGVALYKLLVTTGGDCATGSSHPCPKGSEKWFFLMGGGIPLIIVAQSLTSFGDRGGPEGAGSSDSIS